jgi:hypothetical protein
MIAALLSQLFMFGNDWADTYNKGLLGNEVCPRSWAPRVEIALAAAPPG